MSPFSASNLGREFTYLYSHRYAFGKVRSEKIEKFHNNQTKEISELESKILNRSYSPFYRGVIIEQEKPDKSIKRRGITPLGCGDWIVQRILLKELGRITNNAFSNSVSYGRKKTSLENEARSPANCCMHIAAARMELPFAFRADLIDFFPSIQREGLLDNLYQHLPNNWDLRWLLETIINTDGLPPEAANAQERLKFWPPGTGVHQGTVLAPFFANVAMSPWDLKWQTNVKLFRYVDDWLILGASERYIQEMAKQLKDDLPPGVKCHLDDPKKSTFYSAESDIAFLGLSVSSSCKVRPSQDAIQKHAAIVNTKALNAKNIVLLVQLLGNYNSAWKAYYSTCGLTQPLKHEADRRVETAISTWLENKGFSGSSTVNRFRKLLFEYHPAHDPKIQQKLDFLLETGESRPNDIDDLLARFT